MKQSFLKDVITANQEIYKEIQKGVKKNWQLEYNVGAGGDISTGLDLFSESIFIKYLSKYGKIDSEEAGVVGEGENSIIIDPLDGSSNAYTNFPYFGSSVALINKDSLLEVAVVCNFANGDIFYKFANEKLKVGNLNKLDFKDEKLYTNAKIGIFERSYNFSSIVKALDKEGLKYRAPGAIALSLAYAHRVDYVLFMGENIRVYDFAAGLGLCEDLKVSISDNYVIVTHSKDILLRIENIIKEDNR